jgi:hypothetical protein
MSAPSTPADPGGTASSGFVGSGGTQFAGKVGASLDKSKPNRCSMVSSPTGTA